MRGHLRAALSLGAIVVASAAPTAGDIGGCGQEASLLDEAKFFAQKARIDCESCETCGLVTRRCEAACNAEDGVETPDEVGGEVAGDVAAESFPVGCQPLVHDGEVCLRALSDASCDDYAAYVADEGATTPTECAFCPLRAAASWDSVEGEAR